MTYIGNQVFNTANLVNIGRAHERFDEDLGEALRNPDYLKLSNQLDETYNRKIEESELRRQYEVASIRQWSKVERQGIQNTFNASIWLKSSMLTCVSCMD